jgi:hypothetical protein
MHAIAIPLAVLSGTFSFGGGSDLDLATGLAQAVDKPVALLCESPLARHKPATIRWVRLEDIRAKTKNIFRLSSPVQSAFGFHRGAWPKGMFVRNVKHEYLQPFASFEGKAELDRKGSTVRLRTVKGPVRAGETAKLKWTKPLELHWFFRDAYLCVWSDYTSEEAVLQAIAASVGGKFVASREKFEIRFSPMSHRRMALALLNRLEEEERLGAWKADRRYEAAVFAGLSDGQLLNLYKRESGVLRVSLNDQQRQLVQLRLSSRFGDSGNAKLGGSSSDAFRWAQANVDFDKPPTAVVYARGQVLTSFPLYDPNGSWQF